MWPCSNAIIYLRSFSWNQHTNSPFTNCTINLYDVTFLQVRQDIFNLVEIQTKRLIVIKLNGLKTGMFCITDSLLGIEGLSESVRQGKANQSVAVGVPWPQLQGTSCEPPPHTPPHPHPLRPPTVTLSPIPTPTPGLLNHVPQPPAASVPESSLGQRHQSSLSSHGNLLGNQQPSVHHMWSPRWANPHWWQRERERRERRERMGEEGLKGQGGSAGCPVMQQLLGLLASTRLSHRLGQVPCTSVYTHTHRFYWRP